MNPTEKRFGPQHILHDAELLPHVAPCTFDIHHLEQKGVLQGSAQGRGTTHFIELEGIPCVLRHYRRGGWMAKMLDDRYPRSPLALTRPWREWHLLAKLAALNLPAPRPAAARVVTSGLFYRGDLITRRIEESQPLAQRLQRTPLDEALWYRIGACIKRFHQHGIYHADLNAHNILLDSAEKCYLIDFDKGAVRNGASGWQRANLARLRRSLDKLARQHPHFHFDDGDWQALMAGWQE